MILGKACDLIDEHKNKKDVEKERKESSGSESVVKGVEAAAAVAVEPITPLPSPGSQQSDGVFQLPSEGHQKMFLFQNSCVDKSDVLLTSMNSAMLGQLPEAEEEAGSAEPELGLQSVEERLESSEDVEHRLGAGQTDGVRQRVRGEESEGPGQEAGLLGASRVRSLSSPDLVTDSEQDWGAEEGAGLQ